jgi:hypothetical protein
MVQIGNVLVSLDVFKEKFCCDLSACKGACCIEGDSGAPLTDDEKKEIEKVLPIVKPDLAPEAQAVINRQGVSYYDITDELVTSIVGDRNCVFTCYDDKGCCICALEKAYRDKHSNFFKPISCYLYPIRVTEHPHFTALNYDRWLICKPAVIKGEKENIYVYQFLKEPLIRLFGKEWYDELLQVAEQLKAQKYF